MTEDKQTLIIDLTTAESHDWQHYEELMGVLTVMKALNIKEVTLTEDNANLLGGKYEFSSVGEYPTGTLTLKLIEEEKIEE